MAQCECATIAYYPNDFNDEHINIGFILLDLKSGLLKRKFITKRQRWKEFDDRLDESTIDMLLNVINCALDDTFPERSSVSLFDSIEDKIEKNRTLFELKRMFSNSLRLVDIFNAYPTNIDEYFNDNASLALYFDQEKDKRPDNKKIVKILKNRIKDVLYTKGLESKTFVKVNEGITFGETLIFDYKFDNFLVKIIDPLSGTVDSKINLAKQWAFNISKYFNSEDNLKVIIIVPDEWQDNAELSSIKKIFESVNAQIVPVGSFENRIANLQ